MKFSFLINFKILFFFFLLISLNSSCQNEDKYWQSPKLPYKLDEPNHTITLTPEMNEVSGIVVQENGMMAINDEKGVLYFLNKEDGNIENRIVFEADGDFEDIALVNDSKLFVLKSKGALFELNPKLIDSIKVNRFDPTVLNKVFDTEGLCYDNQNQRLLIACKGSGDQIENWERAIFAFDLKSNTFDSIPVMKISDDDLFGYIDSKVKKNDRKNFESNLENDVEFKFGPSAIAIHPITNDWYIISSVGKLLIVIGDKSKSIKFIAKLPKSLYPQPEGLSFLKDGTLFISSEGKDGAPPVILKFDFKK